MGFHRTLMKLSVILFFCYIGIQTTTAVDCYKCSLQTDDLCLTNPEGTTSGDVTVNCTGYCTTLRVEYTDIPGQVQSFLRDCDPKPLILNDIRTDAHYTKYYKSCTTNKCNGGDGIIGPGTGSGNLPSDLITVPEKSSGIQCTMSLTLFTTLLFLLKFSS